MQMAMKVAFVGMVLYSVSNREVVVVLGLVIASATFQTALVMGLVVAS